MAQEQDFDRRPDPDALLAQAGAEKRGRLWVFLGAAPGVGKTYAMLQRAAALKSAGVDVVVGLVETHGRAETEALTKGLEILPRRTVSRHGRTIEEFDIDAALARRPKLIIVDELAHTNALESRHPKRWQDVEELLTARIDVWTALNIQHIESLADVVARITGVTVRETAPDIVLRDAADIVLVQRQLRRRSRGQCREAVSWPSDGHSCGDHVALNHVKQFDLEEPRLRMQTRIAAAAPICASSPAGPRHFSLPSRRPAHRRRHCGVESLHRLSSRRRPGCV